MTEKSKGTKDRMITGRWLRSTWEWSRRSRDRPASTSLWRIWRRRRTIPPPPSPPRRPAAGAKRCTDASLYYLSLSLSIFPPISFCFCECGGLFIPIRFIFHLRSCFFSSKTRTSTATRSHWYGGLVGLLLAQSPRFENGPVVDPENFTWPVEVWDAKMTSSVPGQRADSREGKLEFYY